MTLGRRSEAAAVNSRTISFSGALGKLSTNGQPRPTTSRFWSCRLHHLPVDQRSQDDNRGEPSAHSRAGSNAPGWAAYEKILQNVIVLSGDEQLVARHALYMPVRHTYLCSHADNLVMSPTARAGEVVGRIGFHQRTIDLSNTG